MFVTYLWTIYELLCTILELPSEKYIRSYIYILITAHRPTWSWTSFESSHGPKERGHITSGNFPMGRSPESKAFAKGFVFGVQKMMGENQDMLKINMLKHVEDLTGSEGKSIFTSPLKHEETMGEYVYFASPRNVPPILWSVRVELLVPPTLFPEGSARGFGSAGRRGFQCSIVAFLCIYIYKYISRLQFLWILGFPPFISRYFSRIEGIQITYIITECTPVNSLYFTVCMWPKLEKSCWPTTMGSSCFTLKRPQEDMWNLNICRLNIHSIEYSGGFMNIPIVGMMKIYAKHQCITIWDHPMKHSHDLAHLSQRSFHRQK